MRGSPGQKETWPPYMDLGRPFESRSVLILTQDSESKLSPMPGRSEAASFEVWSQLIYSIWGGAWTSASKPNRKDEVVLSIPFGVRFQVGRTF